MSWMGYDEAAVTPKVSAAFAWTQLVRRAAELALRQSGEERCLNMSPPIGPSPGYIACRGLRALYQRACIIPAGTDPQRCHHGAGAHPRNTIRALSVTLPTTPCSSNHRHTGRTPIVLVGKAALSTRASPRACWASTAREAFLTQRLGVGHEAIPNLRRPEPPPGQCLA